MWMNDYKTYEHEVGFLECKYAGLTVAECSSVVFGHYQKRSGHYRKPCHRAKAYREQFMKSIEMDEIVDEA